MRKQSPVRRIVGASMFFLITFVTLNSIHANPRWSSERAETMQQARWEIGLFGPLKFGLTDRIELTTHPLVMFVAPNGGVKVHWSDDGVMSVATAHRFFVPTFLFRLLAREGAGGVLPATSEIPFILHLENEVVMSARLGPSARWLTTRFGIATSPRFGASDFPTIDLPIVYARTGSYHSPFSGFAGLAIDGSIWGGFNFSVSAKGYFFVGQETFVAEQQTTIGWSGESFRARIGATTSYGAYAFGEQLDVLPVVDIDFAF